MKYLALLLLGAGIAFGQSSTSSAVVMASSDPTGVSCITNTSKARLYHSVLYTCQSNVFASVASAPAVDNGGNVWTPIGLDCTGATDNTAAISAAISAASGLGGGTVRLPTGCKVKTTSTITIPANVFLTGNPQSYQLIVNNSPASYITFLPSDLNQNAIHITGQGSGLRDIGIKIPTTLGGPVTPSAPTSSLSGVGTLSNTEYVQLTYITNVISTSHGSYGESLLGPEAAITGIGSSCINIDAPSGYLTPPRADVQYYNVYMNGSSSSNGNNKTLQNTTPIAIGSTFQLCAGTNHGNAPNVDESLHAAVFDNNANSYEHVDVFTGSTVAYGSGPAGLLTLNSGPMDICGSTFRGLSAGIVTGLSANILTTSAGCGRNTFERDGWGIIIGGGPSGGSSIDLGGDTFQLNTSGHVFLAGSSNGIHIHDAYVEQNSGAQPFVQLGSVNSPLFGNGKVGPTNVTIDNNFMNCNGNSYGVPGANPVLSPIVIQQFSSFVGAGLMVLRNHFANCGKQFIIDNQAGLSSASIFIAGNTADQSATWSATDCNTGQCGWITNAGSATGALTGVTYYDFTQTSFMPNNPTWTALKINKNASSLPASQTGTVLQLGNADAANSRVELDAFAGSGFFTALRYNGTAAAPTGLLTDDQIGGYNAWGYNGTGVSGPQASFRTFASQAWTATHLGTYADVATTANNGTTLTGVLRFENDGGVTLPSTVTGGDQGAGTLNASGLYVNGTSVNNPAIFTTGTLAAARIPNPSASTLGGIESIASASHQWINSISTSGVPALSQPAFSDVSGSVAAAQLPAFTGDCTTSAGAVATTCTQLNGANFTVNASGTPTKVGGFATTGAFGTPPVLYKVDTGNVNSTISATTIFTPGSAGLYRVTVYGSQIDVGVGCTTGTTVGSIGIQYQDGFTSNNLASSFLMIDTGGSSHNGSAMLTLGSSNTTGTTSQVTAGKTFYMGTGHAVQYQATSYTAGSNCSTNPNYRLIFVIEGLYQ